MPADAERSVGCFGRLSSAAPVPSPAAASAIEDPRIPCAYARSNAELLTIFSDEYVETRQWSSWGPDAAHLPAFTLWAAWYGIYRESTVISGVYERNIKEIIASTVSVANGCQFCGNGHALCARAMGASWSLRKSLSAAKDTSVDVMNERLASFLVWARSFRAPDSAAIRTPPLLLPRDAVELLGTILQVLYKNGMVKLFVGLGALPDAAPTVVRTLNNRPRLLAVLNQMLVYAIKDTKGSKPGRMKEVWETLPEPFSPAGVELPKDVRWSLPNENIADALRFMHTEQERVRTRFIPTVVSSAFLGFLNAWRGGVPNPATDWPAAVETDSVKAAGPDTVFFARFVVVAGVAGEQMPKERLDEFLRRWRGVEQPDVALKSVCSWASWMVARRIVSWMAMPLAMEPVVGGVGRDEGQELPCVSFSMAQGMLGFPVASDCGSDLN
ncbi:hypothetical protein MMPV_005488 [Pyropia vietnamensis]